MIANVPCPFPVLGGIQIGKEFVNAVAPSAGGGPAGLGKPIRDLDYACDISYPVVTDRHIRNHAFWTSVVLALRREQNRISRLRETTPAVLQQVRLEQHPDSTLQLKIILDDHRVAGA